MSEPSPAESHRVRLSSLSQFQDTYRVPVSGPYEAPAVALHSLEDAVAEAPASYADYLSEALACYAGGLYRAAVLMTWSAVVQHLYSVAEAHSGGISAFETANKARFGTSKAYRQIKKADDLLYLTESQFIQLGEDAGMFNRNARVLLQDRLKLRNLCAHPTQYRPGREETVIFVEGLVLNVLGGTILNW